MTTGTKKESLRSRAARGEKLTGGWCTLPTPFASELVCDAGIDYAVVDMQHGLAGVTSLVPMLQAIGGMGRPGLVRIPFADYGMAQRALDMGAHGVIVPMVNSVLDAATAVASCKYPPVGSRSYGPVRARLHMGSDTTAANAQSLCLVQIETAEAIDNLNDIIQVPGVDGVYVGPADLALSQGWQVGVPIPELDTQLDSIATACERHGVIPAIHATSGKSAAAYFSRGYSMCSVGSDSVWLRAAYAEEIALARGEHADSAASPY